MATTLLCTNLSRFNKHNNENNCITMQIYTNYRTSPTYFGVLLDVALLRWLGGFSADFALYVPCIDIFCTDINPVVMEEQHFVPADKNKLSEKRKLTFRSFIFVSETAVTGSRVMLFIWLCCDSSGTRTLLVRTSVSVHFWLQAVGME